MFKVSLGLHIAIGMIVMLLSYGAMWNRVICPAEMRPYVNKFVSEAKRQNISYKHFFVLRIEFSDKMQYESSAAESYDSLSQRNKLIYVNKWSWDRFSEEQRELLIAHELGHSILHRKHTGAKLIDGSPYSIMYPNMDLFKAYTYSRNIRHYWRELFTVQGEISE